MQLLLMYLLFLSSDPLLALPIHTSHRSSHSHFARRENGREGREGGKEKKKKKKAAHISNLQRGVVPNVLDSLCLGLVPERRVKKKPQSIRLKQQSLRGRCSAKVATEQVQVKHRTLPP